MCTCKVCSDKAGYDELKAEIYHLCFSEEEASRAEIQTGGMTYAA